MQHTRNDDWACGDSVPAVSRPRVGAEMIDTDDEIHLHLEQASARFINLRHAYSFADVPKTKGILLNTMRCNADHVDAYK